MAAYDYVSLPGAPDIAHAGNYAQMLQQGLASLPEQYWKGKQNQYEQRQRDLFQDPENQTALNDAIKTGNYAPLLTKLIQSGGAPAAQNSIQILRSQPFFDAALKDMQSDRSALPFWARGSNGQSAAQSPSAAGPANIGPARGAPASGQPQLSSAGMDSAGGETVRSLTAGMANGRDVPAAVMSNLGRAVGVSDLDAPLTAAQEARLRQIGGTYFRGSVGPADTLTQGDRDVQVSPNVARLPASTAPAPGSFGDRFPATTAPPGGQAGQGAPGQTVGAPQGPSFAERTTPTNDIARDLLPPGYSGDSRTFATLARQEAERLRKQAKTYGMVGIPTKSNEDQAAAYDKWADSINDTWKKWGELTDTEKDTRASGLPTPVHFTGAKKQAELDRTRGDKLYTGLQASSRAADDIREHLQAMKGIFNAPGFSSGTAEEFTTSLKKLQASIPSWIPGSDPNASLPNEALRKVTAQNILNQVAQLKDEAAEIGGSSGRIFQQQIQLMYDAAQRGDSSKASLRYLTELGERLGNHSNEVAALATKYRREHGYLDDGFDDVLRKYNREHPMLTKAEMADIRTIAPPVVPKFNTRQEAAQWARREGIKPGDPIKLQSGRTIPAP